MSGLVQQFKVAADTYDQLVLVMRIVLKWHNKVSHYRTGIAGGKPYVVFMWSDDKNNSTPLLATMNDPELVAGQVWSWLKNAEYGREPDHDGDNCKGWCVSIEGNYSYPPREDGYIGSSYEVFTVTPMWIEYGK